MRNTFFSLALLITLAACTPPRGGVANEDTTTTVADVCPTAASAARVECLERQAREARAALSPQQLPGGVTLLETNHESTRGHPCEPVEATVCFEWEPANYDPQKATAVMQFIGARDRGNTSAAPPTGFILPSGALAMPGDAPLPEGGRVYWWRNSHN